jgi:nucleotide-binding universal stress UspA family protein
MSTKPPVVVGYDGSDASRAALTRGIAEAAGSGARLVVVSVAEMPLEVEGPMSFGTPGDGPATSLPIAAPADIEGLLGEAQEQIEAAGVEADYVWETGEPVGALVREARDRGAATIVVGRGHHGRIGRWLGADVAAELERAAPAGCNVIVVETGGAE